LANKRPDPIPVFAEMSSINPVILLPETLKRDAEKTAGSLAGSITLGVGQFCTNPGLILAVEGEGLDRFVKALSAEIQKAMAGTMLHQGIADNYSKKLTQALAQKGVKVEGQSLSESNSSQGRPHVASVSANEFMKNPMLAEEVFGPFSLIVRCKGADELHSVVNRTHGQLTSTIIADEAELAKYTSLLNMLIEKAGRLVVNGVPTGVEVCPSMQHGGPFPATTDSRFSAVGTDAIKRFARPVAFQNFPDSLLPEELKEVNPLKIWRLRNNEWSKK
jgi:2,5-dioxopentanoate dehydrogenase